VGSFAQSVMTAFSLIFSANREVYAAVWTSVSTAAWSTSIASLFGIPIGMAIGLFDFPLKRLAVILLNSLMAMPTVVVGLLVFGVLSRQGMLGSFGLLFTPKAIIFGQSLLATPIIANYALSAVRGADARILPTALTLGAGPLQSSTQLANEIRFGIMAAVIAGFGRVISEVGVAMMLGGNIRWYTRTMTTAIALETSMGEFALGLALGIVLMLISFGINVGLSFMQEQRRP
jgi:tungstate transport system permease protein